MLLYRRVNCYDPETRLTNLMKIGGWKMNFPFKWSLFRGHLHFWRVKMVCLFYGSCCGNHEFGIIKCAAIVPQTNSMLLQSAHKFRETKKTRSHEKTLKTPIQKNRYVTLKRLIGFPQIFARLPSFYVHVIQCAESKRSTSSASQVFLGDFRGFSRCSMSFGCHVGLED